MLGSGNMLQKKKSQIYILVKIYFKEVFQLKFYFLNIKYEEQKLACDRDMRPQDQSFETAYNNKYSFQKCEVSFSVVMRVL